MRAVLHSIGAAGALDLSFLPMLLILLIPNYQSLGPLTTMNLFFLTLGGTVGLMALIVRIFGKDLFKPKMQIDPRIRRGAQVIFEWFKNHEGYSALTVAGWFGFFLLMVIVLGKAFPSMNQPIFGPSAAFDIEIFLLIIIAPTMLFGAIYEGIMHPTGPLSSEELEYVIELHPETELTRHGLEVAAKTKVQVFSKRISWLPLSLLILAMALLELTGYGVGADLSTKTLDFMAVLATLAGVTGFLLLTFLGKKESQYDSIVKER